MPIRPTRFLALAGLLFAAGCTDGSGTGTGPQTCSKQADCPSGQLCRDGGCVAVPCLGACDPRTQICDGSRCVAADGFDCKDDASVCPELFKCTPAGVCQRTCTLDSECPVAPYRSCNPDGLFCGECSSRNDCGGAKPVCDPSTAACVECVENADCRDPAVLGGQYCDSATKKCKVGCQSSDDCPGGLRCKGGGNGNIGKCIECERDDECTISPKIHCEKNSGLCVECTAPGTAHCLRDCDMNRFKCVECVTNQTCQFNAICDASGEEPHCVEGCAGGNGGPNCDPEPARTPVCDANRGANGLCVRCLKDADCPRAQVCDLLGGSDAQGNKIPACVPGCRATPEDQQDPNKRCKLLGNEPAPLPVNVLCSLDSAFGPKGKCVECKANSDCTDPTRPTCDVAKGVCRCAIQGEACSTTAGCGEELSGTVRCNAQSPGTAFCIEKVDCNGATCAGGTKTVTKQCALKGRGGLRCKQGAEGCPWGVADKGYPVGETASRDMCISQSIQCPKP